MKLEDITLLHNFYSPEASNLKFNEYLQNKKIIEKYELLENLFVRKFKKCNDENSLKNIINDLNKFLQKDIIIKHSININNETNIIYYKEFILRKKTYLLLIDGMINGKFFDNMFNDYIKKELVEIILIQYVYKYTEITNEILLKYFSELFTNNPMLKNLLMFTDFANDLKMSEKISKLTLLYEINAFNLKFFEGFINDIFDINKYDFSESFIKTLPLSIILLNYIKNKNKTTCEQSFRYHIISPIHKFYHKIWFINNYSNTTIPKLFADNVIKILKNNNNLYNYFKDNHNKKNFWQLITDGIYKIYKIKFCNKDINMIKSFNLYMISNICRYDYEKFNFLLYAIFNFYSIKKGVAINFKIYNIFSMLDDELINHDNNKLIKKLSHNFGGNEFITSLIEYYENNKANLLKIYGYDYNKNNNNDPINKKINKIRYKIINKTLKNIKKCEISLSNSTKSLIIDYYHKSDNNGKKKIFEEIINHI